MNSLLKSPHAKALEFILHGREPVSNSSFILLDYREKETFEHLWHVGLNSATSTVKGHLMDWQDHGQQILIIGDDPPDGIFDNRLPCLRGINFRDHFTATSWLAAWKVTFPEAMARIAVIDPRPSVKAGSTARALQAILSARSANGHTLVPRATILNVPGLESICRWLTHSETSGIATSPIIIGLLRSGIWSGLTANREDHHSISNVVGAFLLRAEVGGKNTLSAIKEVQVLLHALVRSCGVGPDRAGDGRVHSWIEKDIRGQIDGVVLIDDMAELWEGFVGGAMGMSQKLLITEPGRFIEMMQGREPQPGEDFSQGCDQLAGLPARLTSFLAKGGNQLSSSDLVPIPEADGARKARDWRNFVLFLDLRLGLGSQFFIQLAEFGLKLLDSGRSLPWIEDDGKVGLRVELECLQASGCIVPPMVQHGLPPEETVLPRLLSLLDPTLLIVIFSSTHRTELIEPFRDYGNIITTFRKPILSGMTRDWDHMVKEMRADFTLALEKAARILRARRGLSYLHSVQSAPVETKTKAVEVFIDESYLPDDDVYGVGAVILLAEKHGDIRNFCKTLEEDGLAWGLSFNNRCQFVSEERSPWKDGRRLLCNRRWSINDPERPEKWLRKRATPSQQKSAIDRIMRVAGKCSVKIVAASVACNASNKTTRDLGIAPLQGTSLTQTDELHRELTARLLQTVILAHPEISAAMKKEGASIAVDIGMRTAVPQDYDNRFEELYQRFGFRFTGQDLTTPTVEECCELWNRVLEWACQQTWWQHGTIVASVGPDGSMEPEEKMLEQWTGNFVWNPKRMMLSVSSSEGMNYLRETLSALRLSVPPTIVRARGVALFDFEDTSDWMTKLYTFPCFPYQAHYLADWVARSGAIQVARSSEKRESPLAGIFRNGFAEEWNIRKLDLLRAVIRLERGDFAGGIRDVLIWLEAQSHDQDSTAVRLLLSRAGLAAETLDGSSLRSLFQLTNFPSTEAT